MTQQQLNDTYEYIIFEPGYEYIYVVNLFLFTCFFVSLQPLISFFAIAGLGITYWPQKYAIFNRMQRPVPGTDLINVAMFQILLLGGIFYSIGSLCWSNFFPDGTPRKAIVPNIVALVISFVMFILPYRAIFMKVFEDEDDNDHCLEFSKNRMLLSSEYDRANPSTSTEGFADYMKFIEAEQKRYENASEE